MKHQQVVPDYQVMLNSSITCILLAIGGWILIRLIQAIFMMPRYMARQQELHIQMMKRADRIYALGEELNNDIASTSTDSLALNGKQNGPNEIAVADTDLKIVPHLDTAAPIEVKKVN